MSSKHHLLNQTETNAMASAKKSDEKCFQTSMSRVRTEYFLEIKMLLSALLVMKKLLSRRAHY